jgi:uncharacterized protein YukE
MAKDAGVRNIDDLVRFSQQLKKLGQNMSVTMSEARKQMNQVCEGWQDTQTEKFKVQFDQSVVEIRKISEQFSTYANYIMKLKAKVEEMKNIKI